MLFLQVGPERPKGPFVPGARVHAVVVGVRGVGLVDAVVGQVHETVAEVVYVVVVLDRGEPDQSVRVDVDLQRVEARDEDVEAQIELGAADQLRPGQVLLHDDRAFPRYLRPTVHHLDPGSSGGRRWFHDPLGLAADLLPHLPETAEIPRQHVRPRYEVKLLHLVFQHHPIQVQPEAVLSADLERPREMVDLLRLLERPEARGLHVLAPGAAPLLASLHQLKT